jgi:hypothetical protein
MCVDLRISVISFTTALISGVVALMYNQPILGMLILTYGQMQLSESFIWAGIDYNTPQLNTIGTALGKYLLPAHNIAIGAGIYIKTGQVIPLIIGMAFYLYVILSYPETPSMTTTSVCRDCTFGKLEWPFPHEWYLYSFIISFIMLVLYVKPFYPSGVLIGSFYILTFVLSYFISKGTTLGSFWCWMAAILSPLVVYLNWN